VAELRGIPYERCARAGLFSVAYNAYLSDLRRRRSVRPKVGWDLEDEQRRAAAQPHRPGANPAI
jgi:hypothetical protein